jgi:hypothetical protein
MSIRIMVACEDHTHDQYVAVPIIKLLMRHLGRPQADIKVITNPRLQGISNVLSLMCDILERYEKYSDLVIFVVDGDCEDGVDGRPDRLAKLRNKIESCENNPGNGLVVVARQEVEVWALWGSRSVIGDSWNTVTNERDPKERYFQPLLTTADARMPGGGRRRLTELTVATGWRSLAGGCPELRDLEREVKAKLGL